MKGPPHIGRVALVLAAASVAAFIGGAASLVAAVFWMASVFVPLGIGSLVGGWLLFQWAMERIARDNGVDARR